MTARKVILFFFVIPLLFMLRHAGAEDEEPFATIHICSKQVRLMKEGSLRQMRIVPGEGSAIVDERNRMPVAGNAIVILQDKGEWRAHVGPRTLVSPFHLEISALAGGGSCTVLPGKDERTYPLPLSLRCDGDGPRLYVHERLGRYALDSALAEYGSEYKKDTEAVMALAHIIRARYYTGRRAPVHKDADFCDLTHCQVYRGRIASGMKFDDSWMIDHRALQRTPFFHSRCGGITLGERVFTEKELPGENGRTGVRDWLYRDGTKLCAGGDDGWERSIGHEELRRILFTGTTRPEDASISVSYDPGLLRVSVRTAALSLSYPVESFRLKINRVKGWNFLRSNSFTVADAGNGERKLFVFKGVGLGHGAGLCQHGAIGLSRRGYSRHEICEHYFPDMSWQPATPTAISPYLSYAVFDFNSGRILGTSPGPGFIARTMPPGSIFKLIVSLYLVSERPDIFNEYSYECSGQNRDNPDMPERCWNPKGHGPVRIQKAISHSCNLYFASLCDRISEKRFGEFFRKFCGSIGINASLPEISSRKEWSALLAGLDFRVSFAVDDYINIARFLYNGKLTANEREGFSIPEQHRLAIIASMKETFSAGTASGRFQAAGPACNYLGLREFASRESFLNKDGMWGKTATVIDGTNRPLSYGLFVGGRGGTGIVAVLRKGNGRMAAHWAEAVLSRYERN